MPELTDIINQMDPADIYRTFHPNPKEYALFSAPRAVSQQLQAGWDNILHPSQAPWSKAGCQPPQELQEAYKLTDTEQLSTEWEMGQDRN